MKHRFVRRVSALALAGCLLAGSSLPAFAAASTAKEEVIYANLTASGAVTGVYAVNSFSVQAGDTVADHGSYTAVRNMTTSDAVEQSGDTVTVHVTEDGKLYYEGTMDAATALPWVGRKSAPTSWAAKAVRFPSGCRWAATRTAPAAFLTTTRCR